MSDQETATGPGAAGDTRIEVPSDVIDAIQDLSWDLLLRSMPKQRFGRHTVPVAAGIPLLDELGQGSMGAVYLGYHPDLKQKVAVKLIRMAVSEEDDEFVRRFRREAQMAMMVDSPHLVRVHALSDELGVLVMVMEYIRGKNAGDLLDEVVAGYRPPLAEIDAIDACAAAAKGLGAIHARGIVHRDVKPDNIFIPYGEDGEPDYPASKIGDLGIGRSEVFETGLTQTRVFMGSPGFMAPEQAEQFKAARQAADVYSLGATLYCLLAGRPPFVGRTPIATILKTVEEQHEPVTKHREDVSGWTVTLIERCLNKDPAARYPTGAELAEALLLCREWLRR